MPEYLKKGDEIDVTKFGLGTFIVKFEMPMNFIDDINEIYGGAKNLPKHNQNLAGKIEDELKVSDILTDDMKNCFLACFRQYLQLIQKPFWHCELAGAWINDMKAGEYNPFHFHQSSLSYLGLSSVLVLQRPSTYGKEYSREESPSNGWLEFNGGQQDPLSIPQLRQMHKLVVYTSSPTLCCMEYTPSMAQMKYAAHCLIIVICSQTLKNK